MRAGDVEREGCHCLGHARDRISPYLPFNGAAQAALAKRTTLVWGGDLPMLCRRDMWESSRSSSSDMPVSEAVRLSMEPTSTSNIF